jgi:glucan-binding YG repeat protein
MKLKNKKLVYLMAMSLPLSITACVGNSDSKAKNLLNDNNSSIMQYDREETPISGIIGHYFAAPDFKEYVFSSVRKNGILSLDEEESHIISSRYANSSKQIIKSIRFEGLVKFDKPGRFIVELETQGSDNKLAQISSKIMLDGKNVSMSNPKSALKVNDISKLYKIKIEINSSNDLKALDGLRLVAVNTDNQTSEAINAKNLSSQIKLKGANDDGLDSADGATSNQLLIHANAFNGFTLLPVQSGNILSLSWQDSDYANGSTKYFASSEDIKTTLGLASPWSDEEKIFGPALQAGISPDTDNPVIASYPIIKPLLEGFDLTDTKNISMSFTSDKTDTSNISHSLSSTHEEGSSNSIGISANAGIDAKGPSGGLGFNYSKSWNTSDSSTNGLEYGTSNSLSLSQGIENNFDPSEKARMNIAMKFANYGTAPLEGLNPMLSIAAGKTPNTMQTIVTINSTEARKIERLNVGDVFPHGDPWLFSKIDSFDSTNIQITEEQYNTLKNPENRVVVQLPQLSLSANNPIKWSQVLSRLPQVTAKFILRTPARDIERRIFAANPRGINYYKQPELNLRDGLYTAFKLNALKNSQGQYTGQYTYNAEFNDYQQLNLANYVFESINIITDLKTNSMINAQLSANNKVSTNPLELLKLRPYMNFIVVPTGWVINKSNNKKSYATLEHGFYRNEAALIGESYYLFDAKGELVDDLGLQTIKQGKKVLTYDVNEKGMLNTGFKSDIGGMTPSDVALVKEFVKLGVIKQSLENYCADSHEINKDKVLVAMIKTLPTIQNAYLNYHNILNNIVASCWEEFPHFLQGGGLPRCREIATGLATGSTIQKLYEYHSNNILTWDSINHKYTINETNAWDYFVTHDIAVKQLEVQINSTVDKLPFLCSSTNNKTYYFGPELKTGWVKDQSSWYFFDQTGQMLTGINHISHQHGLNVPKADGLYWFADNGKMLTDRFYLSQNSAHYFGGDGKAITNQVKNINGVNYAFGANANGRTGDHIAHRYSVQGSTLSWYDSAQNETKEQLTSLVEARRKSKDTPDISDIGLDGALFNLTNSLDSSAGPVIMEYRDYSSVSKTINSGAEDVFWNFAWHKISFFKYSYRYDNPTLLHFKVNNENCYLTIYTSRHHLLDKTLNMSIFATKAAYPTLSAPIWQKIYDMPPVQRNITNEDLTKPGVFIRLYKNTQGIYKLDINSNPDNSYSTKFNEAGLDLGVCSAK